MPWCTLIVDVILYHSLPALWEQVEKCIAHETWSKLREYTRDCTLTANNIDQEGWCNKYVFSNGTSYYGLHEDFAKM